MYSDLEIFEKARKVMNDTACKERPYWSDCPYTKRWINVSKDGVLNYEGRLSANFYDAKTDTLIVINRIFKPDKVVINILIDNVNSDRPIMHLVKMSEKEPGVIKSKHYLDKKADKKAEYRKLSEIDSNDSSIGAANEMIMRLLNMMLDSIQSTYEYDYM